ncbi:DELLA protein RGL1-like [Olea europaea var. sylvestris]|uniref:DELLA protein RGL1-like n=1 Tax=Olea europaea var. sylvestris TaxID=158386 RepID=UPI000C1CFE75|nr:DELLA protein RGL1-like [Olea europaea var. sylvestris]
MDKNNSSKAFENEDGRKLVENGLRGRENWVESWGTDSLGSSLGFCQEHENISMQNLLLYKYQQEKQLIEEFGTLNDLYLDVVSPPFQFSKEDINQLVGITSETSELNEPKKESSCVFPSESLGISRNYESELRRLNEQSHETNYSKINFGISSVDSIIKLAAEKFLQSSSSSIDEFSVLSHPYASSFLGLGKEDIDKDVQLVQDLLLCAERVDKKQYDSASKILDNCLTLSSSKRSTIQRLVYYFIGALYEKIDRETGRSNGMFLAKKQPFDVEKRLMNLNPTILAFHEKFPLSQVTQFSGIQSIIEHVANSRKVHIIDLEIRNGMQFAILMQALAARPKCPLDHLKITAIGTNSQPLIEETGRQLKEFAQSMNLNFSFKTIMVEDILDLNKSLFDLDADEAIAVYAAYVFKNMIAQPDRLKSLLKLIKNMNLRVMVVIESEANDNSSFFVNRFVEALFFYGAFFDILEECMKHDESSRTIFESGIFGPIIRNIVVAEGEERKYRHVNIDIWRACFSQFGMVEIRLSMSSIYQANLLLKNFACGGSCSIDLDGKCLIFGWKGTRINSISAWRFQ